MMLKNNLFLAQVINTELKYQYLKNTQRFQSSDRDSVYRAKRYLVNSVRTSLYVNTLVYGMISLIFGYSSLQNPLIASNDGFILFLLLLVLGIMTDSQFYRGIWDMKLLSPIKSLPIKLERGVIPLSLFLYNEFYLPFISLPAGLVISFATRNPIPFIVFLIYTILFIYLSRLISLLLGISFSRTNTSRKSKRLYLGQIFQVVIFVIFILSIEIATNPQFQQYVRIPHYILAYSPMSVQYYSSLTPYPFLLFLAIFAVVYPSYLLMLKRSMSERMESFISVSSSNQNERVRSSSPMTSLVGKDFKLMLRRRGAIMITVIPITFILPILPSIITSKPGSASLEFYVPYISLIFLIDFVMLIGLEGKAAWHLSALPITRRQFFYSKFYSILAIGTIYYAVLMIIVAIANRPLLYYILVNYPYYILILSAILFTGGTYLVRAIPNEVYSLSQEGIGGRWVFLKVFIIGAPVIVLNFVIFSFSRYLLVSWLSSYLRGYFFTAVVDILISIFFLSTFLKKDSHF
jgi:predicted permease